MAHVPCAAVQSRHGPPERPHCVSVGVSTQDPEAAQQPFWQVLGPQAEAISGLVSARASFLASVRAVSGAGVEVLEQEASVSRISIPIFMCRS